ncbi:MAG: hypothetical protein K2F94_06830 [Muribaculaceae bacterium]|nr:hypothetical protein [Muribaculaceae bacterium]MDE6532086.1 hypothetical protein [Muribaculaceae bacterium]
MNTNEFISRLSAIVSEYIAEEEAYSDDVQLQINTVTFEMEIADPENDLPDCDYYPMMDLVRMSASRPGCWEPDTDAIADVAAEYVFTD